MDSYIQNYGQFNTIIDGNVIDDAKWNSIACSFLEELKAKTGG